MDNFTPDKLNSSLKTIVKSSIFVFLFLLFSRVISYFYRIIIAREFGPDVYGSYSLSISIFLFIVTLSLFGFNEGILRFIPLYRGTKKIENIQYILRGTLLFLIISSILFGAILFFSAEFISITIFHNSTLILFLKILSLAFPFFMLASVFLGFIRGFEKAKEHSFISEFLQNVTKLIFLILLIYLGFKTNAIILSHFAGILVVFLIAFFYCRIKLPEIFKKSKINNSSKKTINKQFLFYSLPLIFSGILYALFGEVASILIGIFQNSAEVGFYNVALPLAALMTFLPSLFLQLFFPMITREFSEKNFKLVYNLSKQVQKWIFIINLPIFLLMFVFSGAFINILFGPEYLVAEQTLKILLIGFFFYSMTQVSENLLLVIGKSKLLFTNLAIVLFFNVLLHCLLIPVYGIAGAAISVMISYVLLYLISLFQVRYYLHITPLKKKMILVFVSAIISILILQLIKQFIPITFVSMICLGIFFFLLYFFIIFLTKSLDQNDVMIIRAFRNRFIKTS